MRVDDTRLKLLLVEDDDLVIQSIKITLPQNWRLKAAQSLAEIPQESFNGAFVDMHLSEKRGKEPEGLGVIRELRARDPHLEIVAISGDLNRDLMEAVLKAGATRFLAKPLSSEELILTLDKIEALTLLRDASSRQTTDITWIGESNVSQDLKKQIAALKGEAGPILLEGESGTGKEVISHLIHKQEGTRPFVAVNVAALPEDVFESEVFGHVRGAFTGADQNKMGLAEAANNGDLFLDEVEALPLNLQAKLLRFLESGEIRRVGSKDTTHVKVRVIAATNQNLNQMVKAGQFREDLLWRLSGKKIVLPPLRERKEDIALLSEFFLSKQRPRRNKTLAPEAAEFLSNYRFPGNVRELKRLCEQIALHSPLPIIRKEDVSQFLPAEVEALATGENFDLNEGLAHLLERFEAQVIKQALATGLTSGKEIDQIAQMLKISRSSLYKKIKDYNIELKEA